MDKHNTFEHGYLKALMDIWMIAGDNTLVGLDRITVDYVSKNKELVEQTIKDLEKEYFAFVPRQIIHALKSAGTRQQ